MNSSVPVPPSSQSSGPRTFPIHIVDAFTNKALSGNPAAVCLVSNAEMLTDEEMQKIGAEMNLSETAFVSPQDKDANFVSCSDFSLRWFTPTTEVNLCGHATLASAAVLFQVACNENAVVSFHTKSGVLSVTKADDNYLAMDLPANKPLAQDCSQYSELLKRCVGDLDLVEEVEYSATTNKLLVRLKDSVHRSTLEKLRPVAADLVETETTGKVKGVGLTVKGSRDNGCVDEKGSPYDFVSRYFAPWLGIPEDPVTGSWHTVAGLYWADKLSKTSLYARQCSPRGGNLHLEVKDTRITVKGQAVINLRGTFHL